MEELNSILTERRRQTRRSVYQYLYNSPFPRSKQEIAKELSLSLPTVYQNVSELTDAGLIEYAGSAQPAGGRPAQQLRIVKRAKYSIGISITGHLLRFVAVDLAADEIACKEVRHIYNVEEKEYESFVAGQLEEFISENALVRENLLGVGITVPGIIPPDSSTVFYAPTLSLRNLSLQGIVDAIPYPVRLENDADSGGFAEWYRDHEHKNIAFLSLSEGVGGAVLVNGDRYTGNNFRSGEFGHMCLERNGRQCACGKRGCLEAYCSSSRLSSDLGISPEEFFASLESGNEEYRAIWEEYKEYLATGIHNIRMALDCDVVLGGIISEYLGPYLPEIRELLSESDPFCDECDYIRLTGNPKGSDILGVALWYIRDFLDRI